MRFLFVSLGIHIHSWPRKIQQQTLPSKTGSFCPVCRKSGQNLHTKRYLVCRCFNFLTPKLDEEFSGFNCVKEDLLPNEFLLCELVGLQHRGWVPAMNGVFSSRGRSAFRVPTPQLGSTGCRTNGELFIVQYCCKTLKQNI